MYTDKTKETAVTVEKKMLKRIVWSGFLAITLMCMNLPKAHAFANATSARSTVTGLVFYTSYDTGDVTFTLTSASGIPACTGGFWVRGTDPAARTVIAALLAANAAGSTIVVDADTTQIWAGATLATCLVWDIRL
jgi:hypothetical protein